MLNFLYGIIKESRKVILAGLT